MLVVLIPMGLNVWWLFMNEDKRRDILDKRSKNWHLTAFYTVMGLIATMTFAFFLTFLIAICSFPYKAELYFPSIGWGFLNLLLTIASFVTAIYCLSFIKLIYDWNKYFN